jgi:hydroxyacylglutathione hydrolase
MAGVDLGVEAVESAPFAQNAYVVWARGGREALVIDPGFDAEAIVELLDRRGLTPAAILDTHGHADHIAGNAAMKARYPRAPLLIGRNEAHLLGDPTANLSAPFGMPLTSPPADRLLDDGERVELAGLSFEIREIPGHSPGSVVFVFDGADPPVVLGGDVLFAGSIGRTDLGGDFPRLASGIRSRLYTLPDATVIWPGHGPSTTVGDERRNNPFVRDLP